MLLDIDQSYGFYLLIPGHYTVDEWNEVVDDDGLNRYRVQMGESQACHLHVVNFYQGDSVSFEVTPLAIAFCLNILSAIWLV